MLGSLATSVVGPDLVVLELVPRVILALELWSSFLSVALMVELPTRGLLSFEVLVASVA